LGIRIKSNDPLIARTKLWRLNPEMEMPKIKLAKSPPKIAPMTESIMTCRKLEKSRSGATRYEKAPASRPKMSQVKKPMVKS